MDISLKNSFLGVSLVIELTNKIHENLHHTNKSDCADSGLQRTGLSFTMIPQSLMLMHISPWVLINFASHQNFKIEMNWWQNIHNPSYWADVVATHLPVALVLNMSNSKNVTSIREYV